MTSASQWRVRRPAPCTAAASSSATRPASSASCCACPASSSTAPNARYPPTTYLVRTHEWEDKDRRYYDAVDSIADLDFLGRIQADVSTYGLSEDPAARFEGPTLIVTGRQDTMTGYADAWSILDDYPRATYAVLDQQDHGLPVRRLTAYRALVDDWLDRVEEHLDA